MREAHSRRLGIVLDNFLMLGIELFTIIIQIIIFCRYKH